MTLQNDNFFFLSVVSSWGTYLSRFLTFPICFRCWTMVMVNTEFFGNFSCSCKRISFGDPLNWSLSTSDGQPLHSSSSRLSSPLQSCLNHHCTVHSLAIPGPNALLKLLVFFTDLQPILNSNKKIAQICFLTQIP